MSGIDKHFETGRVHRPQGIVILYRTHWYNIQIAILTQTYYGLLLPTMYVVLHYISPLCVCVWHNLTIYLPSL